MKTMMLAVLLVGMSLVTSGCATPAYSGGERMRMIARNWDFEFKQISDDIDSILLLRPAGRLTIWNVR